MICTTGLHGGVCHRTSTPHKSGNKMKEKKTELQKSTSLEGGNGREVDKQEGDTFHDPDIGNRECPRD